MRSLAQAVSAGSPQQPCDKSVSGPPNPPDPRADSAERHHHHTEPSGQYDKTSARHREREYAESYGTYQGVAKATSPGTVSTRKCTYAIPAAYHCRNHDH